MAIEELRQRCEVLADELTEQLEQDIEVLEQRMQGDVTAAYRIEIEEELHVIQRLKKSIVR